MAHEEVHFVGSYRKGKVDRNTVSQDSKVLRSHQNTAFEAVVGIDVSRRYRSNFDVEAVTFHIQLQRHRSHRSHTDPVAMEGILSLGRRVKQV